ncbi:MAG TPA: hypothetical protein VEH05_00975, partial [Streptosporangiaceae bacterium]|nr:hypothetical protein [Streptosporangiaceae bacterium]
MTVDWNAELLDQLEWHWEQQLRPAPGRADRRRVLLGASVRLLEHPPPGRERGPDLGRRRGVHPGLRVAA